MDAAKVELMRALGRLVRGLSTLFWGLPVALLIDVETARTDWLGFLGDAAFVPAVLGSVALYYGLRQLRDFQKQERIWHQALNRAEILVAPISRHHVLHRLRRRVRLRGFAAPHASQPGPAPPLRHAARRKPAR
jgi:hypothetical protein